MGKNIFTIVAIAILLVSAVALANKYGMGGGCCGGGAQHTCSIHHS